MFSFKHLFFLFLTIKFYVQLAKNHQELTMQRGSVDKQSAGYYICMCVCVYVGGRCFVFSMVD